MAEYSPIDDGVQVNHRTVTTVEEAFPDGLKSQGENILKEAGIEYEEEWHLQADWLEAFSQIKQEFGERTLSQIGKQIPKQADWPNHANTIEDGVEAIQAAYQMNHRNGEIGEYKAEQTGENEIHVTCTNPYPCSFDMGIIKGVAREFSSPDERVRINEINEDECREKGGDSCTYHIRW